jgi:nucleoside-diphosphate-sugar epimerase
MKNILITGGNGYIAKSIYNAFKDKYNVTSITRLDFDLTDSFSTLKYFSNKYFDIVIHCAVSGGSRLKPDTWGDMDNNLKMYYNLLNCKDKYKKLIHLGSGAETYSSDLPYGLSKKVISNSISSIDNFYNIRIFAVFNEDELETRFIKGNIKRYIDKKPIIIHQDKWMDFFYMGDLIHLLNYYINNDTLPKQVDCSYNSYYRLSDIADIINELDDYKVEVKIEKEEMTFSYCGTSNTILSYTGLAQGIKNTYNKLKLQ